MNTSPIDRTCPFCAAEPGRPCARPNNKGAGFHSARLAPAVRGASFSGSKNLEESRALGARRGNARKKARARRTTTEKPAAFSVWWYVAAPGVLYTGSGHFASPVDERDQIKEIDAREARRWTGAVLLRPSEVREARRFMRDKRFVGRVRVVRVTVRAKSK